MSVSVLFVLEVAPTRIVQRHQRSLQPTVPPRQVRPLIDPDVVHVRSVVERERLRHVRGTMVEALRDVAAAAGGTLRPQALNDSGVINLLRRSVMLRLSA